MLKLIFYLLFVVGFIISIRPLINLIGNTLCNIWIKYDNWRRKRNQLWMDALHRGKKNYEYYDPDA